LGWAWFLFVLFHFIFLPFASLLPQGGAANNTYSSPLGFVFSRLDTDTLAAGTCGKTIQGAPYEHLVVQPTEWNVSRFVTCFFVF
jgi:hypothetical protein